MNRISNIFIWVAIVAIVAFSFVAATSLSHYGAWTVGILAGLGILAAGFLTLAVVASMGDSWERSAE